MVLSILLGISAQPAESVERITEQYVDQNADELDSLCTNRDLLEQASEWDANYPMVMLVKRHSLLFKPSVVGGDPNRTIDRLKQERRQLEGGFSAFGPFLKAGVWLWYTKGNSDYPGAFSLRNDFLDRGLPPLFKEFLSSEPS